MVFQRFSLLLVTKRLLSRVEDILGKRSVTIPGEINRDKVSAKYEYGILYITLPKKEEAKVKEIKIEVN